MVTSNTTQKLQEAKGEEANKFIKKISRVEIFSEFTGNLTDNAGILIRTGRCAVIVEGILQRNASITIDIIGANGC